MTVLGRLLGVVSVAVAGLAVACGSDDDSNDDKKGSGNGSTFTFGGDTAHDKGGPEPTLQAYLSPAYVPAITEFQGGETGIFNVNMRVYTSVPGATSPGTYTISEDISAGNAAFTLLADSSNFCVAAGGTVEITSYGNIGSPIVGTINVTSWADGAAPFCANLVPPPQAGSFSVVRLANDTYGVQDGVDTVSLTRSGPTTGFDAMNTYTETALTPYDPRIQMEVSSQTTFTVKSDLNTEGTELDRSIRIYVTGTSTGTYNVDFGEVEFEENVDDVADCEADAGTVEITSFGPPGSLVEGSINVTSSTGGACPTAWSGTFAVTYE